MKEFFHRSFFFFYSVYTDLIDWREGNAYNGFQRSFKDMQKTCEIRVNRAVFQGKKPEDMDCLDWVKRGIYGWTDKIRRKYAYKI